MDIFGIKHAYYRRKTHQRRLGVDGSYFLKCLDKIAENEVFQFNVEGYNKPLFLRNKTSDIATFYHCIFDEEYDIALDFTPELIIDLGANIGLTSLYFNKVYPKAKIIAIEPEVSNFDILMKNVNQIDQIKPINAAIWDKDIDLVLLDEGHGHYGYTVFENKENKSGTVVKCITLASVLNKFQVDKIDVLKVDIEGAERELFQGNVDVWLGKTRVLIIELHDRMRAGCTKSVFKSLSAYNYEMKIKGENLVFYFNH